MPGRVKRNCSIGRAAFTAVTMLAAPAGQCGPPFQTDDPNIVGLKRTEVLSYYQSTLAESGRSGTLPGLELHYGAFERTELDLILPYAFHSSAGSSTAHGYGDTVVGIKYALLPQSGGFLLSAVPKVSFPGGNASRGLGNAGTAIFLALAAQQTSGDFTTFGNAGYWINNGAGNRDYAFIGGVAQWRFSERWTLGAEMFYNGPTVEGQRASLGFNVGGFFTVRPGSQILFSAGRGLVSAAETNCVSAYVGVQFGF
jgi:hypothetical protein